MCIRDRLWAIMTNTISNINASRYWLRHLRRPSAGGQRYNKFDRSGLSRLLHTELHWLDVPEWVAYKLIIMMCSCMYGQVSQHLTDFCHLTSSVASRQQLRTASRRLLVVLRCRLSTTVRRAFSAVGPSVWNSLPEYLCDPAVSRNTFKDNVRVCFIY